MNRIDIISKFVPMKKKFKILVSNDDGISSAGIIALRNAMLELGEVIVYAPHKQQSAVGHAITVQTPLRIEPHFVNDELFGYAVTGTPADCVKLAISSMLDEPPDLVVSGINHGANVAINVLYSGTVSAATEGRILDIPSIAFSMTSFEPKDFSYAEKVAQQIAREVLEKGLPPGILLNVNIPAVPENEIQGIVVTRQGISKWNDIYERRIDPNQREYFWLTGSLKKLDIEIDSDVVATHDNFVSVTPIQYDLTAYDFLPHLKTWKLNGR